MNKRSETEELFALLYCLISATLHGAKAPGWLCGLFGAAAAINYAGSLYYAHQEAKAEKLANRDEARHE